MININDIKIYPEEIEGSRNTPVHPFSVMIDEHEWFGKLRFDIDPKRYDTFTHHNLAKAADICYMIDDSLRLVDVGHNTIDFVEKINDSREKISEVMMVKDDPIKNGDTGVSTVTNPVMSRL